MLLLVAVERFEIHATKVGEFPYIITESEQDS